MKKRIGLILFILSLGLIACGFWFLKFPGKLCGDIQFITRTGITQNISSSSFNSEPLIVELEAGGRYIARSLYNDNDSYGTNHYKLLITSPNGETETVRFRHSKSRGGSSQIKDTKDSLDMAISELTKRIPKLTGTAQIIKDFQVDATGQYRFRVEKNGKRAIKSLNEYYAFLEVIEHGGISGWPLIICGGIIFITLVFVFGERSPRGSAMERKRALMDRAK